MRSFELLLLEGIRAGQFGGDIEPHGDHALGFVSFLDSNELFTGTVIDIGSGAGLPALPLIEACPDTCWTLIERRSGRTELMTRAVHRLGWVDRVDVLASDVAVAGWSALRGSADWVTARSFGSPADTAEVAAPLLKVGGSLLTSEPRDVPVGARWPEAGLAIVGLEFAEEWTTVSGRYMRFLRTETPLDTLPRKGSRKRPLF